MFSCDICQEGVADFPCGSLQRELLFPCQLADISRSQLEVEGMFQGKSIHKGCISRGGPTSEAVIEMSDDEILESRL